MSSIPGSNGSGLSKIPVTVVEKHQVIAPSELAYMRSTIRVRRGPDRKTSFPHLVVAELIQLNDAFRKAFP